MIRTDMASGEIVVRERGEKGRARRAGSGVGTKRWLRTSVPRGSSVLVD
jgi:hypothetical protein